MPGWLIGALITWLVITVSFLIVSRLPIGVEIDSFEKAAIAAAVFGVLNGGLHAVMENPIISILALPLKILTLGLLGLILNVIVFGVSAALVEGFRLRWGWGSAVLGASLYQRCEWHSQSDFGWVYLGLDLECLSTVSNGCERQL